VGDAETEALKN
jgi:hypothetical protein